MEKTFTAIAMFLLMFALAWLAANFFNFNTGSYMGIGGVFAFSLLVAAIGMFIVYDEGGLN